MSARFGGDVEPTGPFDGDAAVATFQRLLGSGSDQAALELAAAAAPRDERFQVMAGLVAELRRVHFGGPDGSRTDEKTKSDGGVLRHPATAPEPADLMLASVRVAARIRPGARGSLTTWERSLLLSFLPERP